MALLTKRERETSEVKIYILRRLAADDLSELECREMVGLLKLSRSGFWQNAFITELLCDYGAGERSYPNEVMALLGQSIEAIESAAGDPIATRRLTGKRVKAAIPICDQCGGQLVYVAGDGVRAIVCPVCDPDSSALEESR